ncbi:MAG TPA: hypothetical protein VJC07_01675 [Candidatus Nanoarchaeia archaeon]|nr:hypothetical protein [Candidatus Nanoarchaeia archaeon]
MRYNQIIRAQMDVLARQYGASALPSISRGNFPKELGWGLVYLSINGPSEKPLGADKRKNSGVDLEKKHDENQKPAIPYVRMIVVPSVSPQYVLRDRRAFLQYAQLSRIQKVHAATVPEEDRTVFHFAEDSLRVGTRRADYFLLAPLTPDGTDPSLWLKEQRKYDGQSSHQRPIVIPSSSLDHSDLEAAVARSTLQPISTATSHIPHGLPLGVMLINKDNLASFVREASDDCVHWSCKDVYSSDCVKATEASLIASGRTGMIDRRYGRKKTRGE